MRTSRGAIPTIALAGLLGCSSPPAPPMPAPMPVPGGFVELDENTDPVFAHNQQSPTIGSLLTRGDNVRLNGDKARGRTPVGNRDRIDTGSNSFARVEFVGGFDASCNLRIQGLRPGGRSGQLYGEAPGCSHEIDTPHAGLRTEGSSRYHVRVKSKKTTVTVGGGSLVVWQLATPAQPVVVGGLTEVEVTKHGISAPRPISPTDFAKTIDWRPGAFDERGRGGGGGGKALLGVLAGAAAAAVLLDDDAPSDETVAVPNVLRQSLARAREILKAAGLRDQATPGGASGGAMVVDQSPDPGARVPRGTTVVVTVRSNSDSYQTPDRSTQPLVAMVAVPNLARMTQKQAIAALAQVGLSASWTPRDARSDYWVLSQSPGPGQRVATGSVVQLTLSPPIR